MNRGRARQLTFIDDADDMTFLETLAEAHRLWGIEGFAYSLMGNHYHLCLRTRNVISLGSCATLMVYIPSDSTDAIDAMGRYSGGLLKRRNSEIVLKGSWLSTS
jgi:hypothetical protein